ncbi:unnamed protein product, partial [Cylicostephanus goldi]
ELHLGKKKKTKKVIKLDDDEPPAPTPEAVADDLGELKLGGKKKKKVKVEEDEEKKDDGLPDLGAVKTYNCRLSLGIGIGVTNLIDATRPWPDYTYDECLTLVFNIMREKNPELSGEKKKFAMKPPEVARAGSKKTAFSNFAEICRLMKRQDKHVLQFLLAELVSIVESDQDVPFAGTVD